MKVAISGASGFVGSALTDHLINLGYDVRPIERRILSPDMSQQLREVIDSADVVINLAGETIDQRWTPSSKLRILESRVMTTRAIVAAMNTLLTPKLLISASAVGIYPSVGCHDESSSVRSDTFLAEVCRDWEHEARQLAPHHSLSVTRFGVVFAVEGGAFRKLTATLNFSVMPRIGRPTDHITWVDRDDLLRAMVAIIESDELRGVVNICAPEQTTQRDLVRAAGALITLPVPSFVLRMTHGEAADLVLRSCCARPTKLIASGFEFSSPTIVAMFDKAYIQNEVAELL